MARDHIEIKKIKGKNYAYTTVNLWDKINKKEIKVSRYLGRLNENNEIERKVTLPERSYQYGDVALLVSLNMALINKIAVTYDKYWREIVTSAIITIVGRIPMEYVKRYYRKTILYHYWPKLKLEPKNLTSMLRYLAVNKLAFEKLEEFDESTLILHVELIIPVYAVNRKNRYSSEFVTLDIVFDPVEMRILNSEHFIGSEYMFSRFLDRTEDATRYDGVLVLESAHYSQNNITSLIKDGKYFIMDVPADSVETLLKKYGMVGGASLRRGFNSLLNRYLYHARVDDGRLHYYIMDDMAHGEMEYIKPENNGSLIVVVSNMNLHENLIYQAINIRRFMYSSISSSKYRLDSDRNLLPGRLELDGYILLNIITMKLYLSLYRNTSIPGPGRHKLVDSLMIELSTVNMYLLKGELYMPKISKSIMDHLNVVGGGLETQLLSKKLFENIGNN